MQQDVNRSSFRAGLVLIAGIALLAASWAIHAILVDGGTMSMAAAILGAVLTAWGLFSLRGQLSGFASGRRGEIALFTLGTIGVLVALAYLSVRFPARFDLSETREHSLADATVAMLKKLDKPVHVVFFNDPSPIMQEAVERYQLMAKATSKLTVEFHDPMLSPAQARLMGVQFAGTAVLQSEGRKLLVNQQTETDIANGILRISQGATQKICFLDGHNEGDPFSIESHDHMEGDSGHNHGFGSKMIVHEQHGMAKARTALETMNYSVEKISLPKTNSMAGCGVLVVAGPKSPLLPSEVSAIQSYLDDGGNGLFMLDPLVDTGLEPVISRYGITLNKDLIIDDASHFWADPSAPAVTDYNRHQITRQLPLTFFPGARSLSPTAERPPGISVIPLVNTSKKSYGETTADRAEFNEGQDNPGPNTIMAVSSRRPETANTAKQLAAQLRGETVTEEAKSDASKLKRSRVAVVGDADFATNSFFHIMGNGNLFLNTVNYLAAQENLIGLEPRTFDVPRVNLTNRQMKGTFFLSVILIPALLAIIGTAVWWRQR